ncbi:Peptidoglycan/LPS O-acetylase OafA/YrhL, contains acyltransferase and SGNH-hydrolase domains [Dyella sp. OK004]|uniref:acyltransferase family protein n=1 Tax=Dyella sp. OK004 TaxID=1855292 RepID=UPI0008EC1037|nr:acyltransferase [Dyella sp. OK004]SFS15221.1 Peptidoglycan/LPS O-acetylase OafA/YrhL, contains acyltransferase and SGNH-hydrolase domains [Dyella sp. OK004]
MQRLPGLDLLRAIAIVWVMLFHSYIVGGIGDSFSFLEKNGWMGVDLFFVLSGYLIGSQLLKPLSQGRPLAFGRFYMRRSFRVLPAFLVVLAVYFTLPWAREAEGIQPLWQFLTYTVNFLIDYEHNRAFSHVWSLCVEEHFYLLFPFLAWWLVRRPSVGKFVGVCVALIVGGMWLRGYLWHHMDGRFVEVIYFPTYNRIDGLLAGVVLASIQTYRPVLWQRLQDKASVLLLAGCVAVGLSLVLFQDRAGLAATVVGYPLLSWGLALVVVAGTSPSCWLGRKRVPGAGWIALISYSLYLSHKIVFHLVEAALAKHQQIQGLMAFAVYAVVTLAGGALLYYTVERPFLRLRDRIQRPGHEAMPAVFAPKSAGA